MQKQILFATFMMLGRPQRNKRGLVDTYPIDSGVGDGYQNNRRRFGSSNGGRYPQQSAGGRGRYPAQQHQSGGSRSGGRYPVQQPQRRNQYNQQSRGPDRFQQQNFRPNNDDYYYDDDESQKAGLFSMLTFFWRCFDSLGNSLTKSIIRDSGLSFLKDF